MSDTELFCYVPEEVTVLVMGVFPLTGFVDGTFIEITKDVDPFTTQKTADGLVSRVYNNDQTYTISLTLHSGTQSNDLMTKLWQLDEITQRGKFPLLIKDSSGSDLFFSTNTWVQKIPSLTKSNSVDNRVWVLRSSQAAINVGGNVDASSILDDITNLALGSVPALQGLF